ncbi:MAG: FAD-dependent oxidoreductase [Candidatus Riflebacteria bacterium]|nr:FAD-dependent oxidoreductase [Candidatus Riflebacteria bacterium]
MSKFATVEEFAAYRRQARKEQATEPPRPCLVTCAGTCGQASGSNDTIRVLKRQIAQRNLQDAVSLRITGCQGLCEMNPFLLVEPAGNLYPRVRLEDVPRLLDAALAGQTVPELLYHDGEGGAPVERQQDIPFFHKQTRRILGPNRKIDPIRILNYIEQAGYVALEMALRRGDPQWVVDEVTRSGLRGRGGAGFPTGKKWELARKAGNGSRDKYVVCNADEGDPGAYMDRGLLEGNPHAILEGMLLSAFAIGADKGIVYVRSEYPLAIKHALIAIRQAEDFGLLGRNVLGTGLAFDVTIVRGAGAFVCGEETALIRSVEGGRPEPRERPPYPIDRGIHGRPTCINNVETLANVPFIIREGADEFVKLGAPRNTGTKIFSLVGKIKNTGLVEVPLGTKVREVVYDIGGGPKGKAPIKAVQTGGPSGGCIPVSLFDLPLEYDALVKAGTIMGSGGMIVMDDATCMVDVAKYFTNFLKDESCGKCFPCRKGTQRMAELLDDITRGRGTLEHLSLLEELAVAVKETSMCGLGRTASNPVLSTLRYFRDEYVAHIVHKRCPAMVCKELVGAPCQSGCPLGTEVWRYVAHLRWGEYEQAYRVIRESNPFPSVCARVCSHPCESHCRLGTTGGEPIAIRALKRFITDRVEPSAYQPVRAPSADGPRPPVAVVGAGPAGLTAAHHLSLMGYRVTVFEALGEPGGMMIAGIPSYRLPREVLRKEIQSLLDENITLKCQTAVGRDFTIDGLFDSGFGAVFLAIGAHRSRRLGLALRAINLEGRQLAKGHVGVIGGGNSAVDAARAAVRMPGVESVTLYYRRTRSEMPAFQEEIDASREEGIGLVELVTPVEVLASAGQLTGVVFQGNALGEFDESGRRSPVPLAGTTRRVALDTLIVAIGEQGDVAELTGTGIDCDRAGAVKAASDTLETSRAGVFAGGDAVTGPGLLVDAIAAARKAACSIDRYLRGVPLRQPAEPRLPRHYVEPGTLSDEARGTARRAQPPVSRVEQRRQGFAEVEGCLGVEGATGESRRCLRCDLDWTAPKEQ